MAMIIKLKKVTETAQDDAVFDDMRRPQAAEVILFPGVRYERWSDKPAKPGNSLNSGRSRTGVQRDWLDI